MNKPSAIRWTLFAALSLSLISCATAPPDVFVFEALEQHLQLDPTTMHLFLVPSPVCQKEIGEIECGHGVAIVSKKEIFVGENALHRFNNKPWSQVKRESIYMPAAESYAPMEDYMINSCKKMNCNDQVTRFKLKPDSFKAIGDVLRRP